MDQLADSLGSLALDTPVSVTRVTAAAADEKTSFFFITINSNQNLNLEDTAKFDQAIQELFSMPALAQWVVKFLLPGASFSKAFIQNVKMQYCVERGLKKKRVHAHVFLQFWHTTKLQLRIDGIKRFMELHGFPNCYVNIRMFRDESKILRYLAKSNE